MSRLAVIFLMIIAQALSLILALLGVETIRTNSLGWFLFVLGIAYPTGSIIKYFIQKRNFWGTVSKNEGKFEEKSDLSFWGILPGCMATIFAPPIEWYYFGAFLPRWLDMEIGGWVLIMAGSGLFLWARVQLRDYYQGHLSVTADQKLVQEGPYHLIRHPAYCGMILLSLGVGLGYSSLIGILSVLFLLLPGIAYRINVEERLLTVKFGNAFVVYSKKTKKIIPYIW